MLRTRSHGAVSFPASARPDGPNRQGEHPSISYAQRLVLDRVQRGLQLGDLATDEVVGPLLDADLVTETMRDGRLVGWELTDEGRAVLEAHRQMLPPGWSRGIFPSTYRFKGQRATSVTTVDPDDLECGLELAEAKVALYRHLIAEASR